ncbi:hypothetical protein V500_04686 [Pseudogymnoascus sp. VKM F-4518 (FW-2643)]|nr:hypothetical protein V500_04686 [Pseudogymnoascus sp. VKM F-4518 (FW-2643)]
MTDESNPNLTLWADRWAAFQQPAELASHYWAMGKSHESPLDATTPQSKTLLLPPRPRRRDLIILRPRLRTIFLQRTVRLEAAATIPIACSSAFPRRAQRFSSPNNPEKSLPMEHHSPLQIFTITQLELGSPLIWEPAVGTAEHDRLVDAYIPGAANLQQKRATIALDFFDTAAASTMPAPFCRTYLVATNAPEFAAGPSYSPEFAPTTSFSPSTYTASTPSSFSASASSASLSSKSSKRSISSLSSAASASPAKRLPGFSIMTADGVDITNNQSRGPKTKAQREQAAKMRKLGACPACKRSKQKCEPSHHRPAPMSASSSQNPSSASSPWQSSGSASASTSPGSRASISPHTSFGQSFSPASHAPKAAADLPCSFAFPTDMANDFVPGDWGFLSDQLLADNRNVPGLFPSDFLDFDAAAALDEDLAFLSAPASADNVFPHVEDRPNMQPRGFEGGAWYDDFVLSSYFNGGDAHASLSSAPASVCESSARAQASASTSPSRQTDSSHAPGSLESDGGLRPLLSSGETGGSSGSPEMDLFRDRNARPTALEMQNLWRHSESDTSSPDSITSTIQPQSNDDILDDPSDPVPRDRPGNAMRSARRLRTFVTPEDLLSIGDTVEKRRVVARADRHTANPRVTDRGDLPSSRTVAQRLEDLQVLWAEPSNTTSTTPRRQTRVTSKHILAPTSRDLPIAHAVPYTTDLRVTDEGDLPPSRAMTQAMVANQHQRMEYLKVLRDSRRDLAMSSHRPPSASASASSLPSEQDTQPHTAVARYLLSSASSPSSPRAAASGEDGRGECRDRHKALRKPAAPCACTTPTAAPWTALCACTAPSAIPATVASPSRLSTSVLGGMLDGIRRRVLSFFSGEDTGVEGLVRGMGRLGVV